VPVILYSNILLTGQSIVLTNGSTKSNNLLVNPVTVDFARFNGLQGLVDMNDVQTGTYTGVTIGLGTSNEIDYLNTSAAPPTISTITPTLTTSTVNITLNNPLKVSATGGVPVGLRMDLDLGQSIETSGGGITGTINPTFDVKTVARTDNGAHIDEFIGSVTTAPSSATATTTPSALKPIGTAASPSPAAPWELPKPPLAPA